MIELENITKTYKMGKIEVQALRGVSLTVQSGEMVAIMGPSGSGKSTMMNIIGCLDKPTSGIYLLEGVEVSHLSDDKLAAVRSKRIGFVFQTFNLLPRTSAITNVELPMVYSGTKNRRQKASDALERVGLLNRAKHKPSELSGGEQQRVAIARALVQHPAIILADEPTGNLDSKTSLEIMKIFHELNQKDGITIILVTHEREIGEHARRIISFRDGEISNEEILAK
ncbi:MAG: ABC transporter ATP-binding protein [Dehalococcoidia bacterium]|nr:ABC transporter ATP-binding protein [Dehalococcoidia bacterium]MDZ4245928.1 ABC transporter ATP-binding protein [Dehalococcoidia bacterium]